MSTQPARPQKLRVVVVGAGVAGLETVLALADLAPDRVASTVLAPDGDFVYRPMTVREPFAYTHARRYPLATLIGGTGAELIDDKLDSVDRDRRIARTAGGRELEYDALVLAPGAHVVARYEHALTIDDRRMDETLHGLIQDIEGGYVDSIAFVAPGRMAWPLPLYELALLTAGRAYDMSVQLTTTVITPESSPLAIFGSNVSQRVARLLRDANVQTLSSAYAEISAEGEIVVNPGDRHVHARRVIALPELYGPKVRGIALGEHGFIRVDRFGQVPDAGPVYAAGDAIDFPIKHGGLGSQQADVVAESIAALAGAPVAPQPFDPVVNGMLLTYERPYYLSAHITGGHGFSSQFSETPLWTPASKIDAKYLSPYLDSLDHESAPA
jgi:sulfide:quinone oxidoreductase